jgi:glycosyltransferase involved in cell wall biosynthesis
VDGDEKARLLDRAGMFVLPSRDENFGVASAEALALGLPQVLTAGVSHAPAVEAGGAGVTVQRDPQAIATAAAEVSGLSENEYWAMCDRARELARTRYRWSSTARRLLDLAARGSE